LEKGSNHLASLEQVSMILTEDGPESVENGNETALYER